MTKEFSHIVWTTHGCWKPDDQRGDWTQLGDFYNRLLTEFAGVKFSRALPHVWNPQAPLRDHVSLGDKARAQLGADIRKLSVSDRVAGNMPVVAIAVEPTCVQLVLSCDAASLSQKVGRLKSRTATLLKFNPETGVGGKNTWGKGFWYASFVDQKIVECVAAFVNAP